MKTDILLLADVFEKFRESCQNTYGLDPAHYFTTPGYTWDAMLKYTKQELELLTDLDMFLFVEQGILGGLSQVCSKKRARANNKYVNNYDPSKPQTFLMYFDVNNQDAFEDYILDVDLKYPKLLHDLHKDILFCPEHLNPKTSQSPKFKNKIRKLMATHHHHHHHHHHKSKTMENRLLTEWNVRYGAEAYIAKPKFKNCTIFSENFVAVKLCKLHIRLNKPIYAGQAILDLAMSLIKNIFKII
ncbi:unnamed protein product [Brassicogethes aeneus]|uniref:Uncharacterized protein n=1 Tax=Brassicogethes aeneus TaxID=1431903 RepID=A0A9P0FHL0_BRAAE|nr:unnamed protein product [Brassicogethes aeneus]